MPVKNQFKEHTEPWNKGKIIGQKPPLKLQEIWAIRIRLQLGQKIRDLALFNKALPEHYKIIITLYYCNSLTTIKITAGKRNDIPRNNPWSCSRLVAKPCCLRFSRHHPARCHSCGRPGPWQQNSCCHNSHTSSAFQQ